MTRLENLLGALALALTDRLLGAGPASPGSVSERAALVTLHAHTDRPVSWLGQVLGLTSSGVTRLVDRLVAGGWVTRTPGSDARSRELTLSAAGLDQARAVLRARAEAMAGAVRRAVRGGPRRARAAARAWWCADSPRTCPRPCGCAACATGVRAPRAGSDVRSGIRRQDGPA